MESDYAKWTSRETNLCIQLQPYSDMRSSKKVTLKKKKMLTHFTRFTHLYILPLLSAAYTLQKINHLKCLGAYLQAYFL